MSRPTETIVNCETGEVTIREFTDEEIALMEQRQEEARLEKLAFEAELVAKKAAKESAISKLLELGLTEEEAKALSN